MSFIKQFFVSLFSRKILSSFLLLAFFIPALYLSIPAPKAHAQWAVFDGANFKVNTVNGFILGGILGADTTNAVNTSLFNVKKFLLDGLAWNIAKLVLRGITAQTVNWINGGFQGNPAFITDPTQFFTNVGDLALVKALGDNGSLLNKICTPFRPQIRLALAQNYLQEGQLGQCSIQQIVKNYDAFTQDFSQGGWDGWFSMTQNMQNNPYGSYLAAQNELTLSINNQTTQYQKQLDWGKGFLSFEKCDTSFTNASGQKVSSTESGSLGYATPNYAQEAADANLVPKCTTVTPGSVVQDQLVNNLGSGVKSLEASDEINEIIGALMTTAIKAVVGGISSGLRGLSQSTAISPRSLVEQLASTSMACEQIDASTGKCLDTQSAQNIISALPSSLAQATDPKATSTPLTLPIDQSAVDAQIAAEKLKFQQENGSCTTNSGGQISCTAGTGSTSGNTSGGGTSGTTCNLPPYSTNLVPGQVGGCKRVNTFTCQVFAVGDCASPLGANEYYTLDSEPVTQ